MKPRTDAGRPPAPHGKRSAFEAVDPRARRAAHERRDKRVQRTEARRQMFEVVHGTGSGVRL